MHLAAHVLWVVLSTLKPDAPLEELEQGAIASYKEGGRDAMTPVLEAMRKRATVDGVVDLEIERRIAALNADATLLETQLQRGHEAMVASDVGLADVMYAQAKTSRMLGAKTEAEIDARRELIEKKIADATPKPPAPKEGFVGAFVSQLDSLPRVLAIILLTIIGLTVVIILLYTLRTVQRRRLRSKDTASLLIVDRRPGSPEGHSPVIAARFLANLRIAVDAGKSLEGGRRQELHGDLVYSSHPSF